MRKDFLWGGAVAAHQVEGGFNEGGKGPNVSDMMTVGSATTRRKITKTIEPDQFYQIIQRLISITTIRKISLYLKKWDLNVLEHLFPGQESSQWEMKKHQMKKA